jgi:hypothetical protein
LDATRSLNFETEPLVNGKVPPQYFKTPDAPELEQAISFIFWV